MLEGKFFGVGQSSVVLVLLLPLPVKLLKMPPIPPPLPSCSLFCWDNVCLWEFESLKKYKELSSLRLKVSTGSLSDNSVDKKVFA